MTREGERLLLASYMATAARLVAGFDVACERTEPFLPMTAERMAALALDDETTILAFLKRFEQLADTLHRTIKTVSQLMDLNKPERMHARDVANRAEKFGIVADADRWSDVVRTRNAVAHEYPLRPDKQAEQVNAAWAQREALAEAWAGIQKFVAEEKLGLPPEGADHDQ